MYIGTVYPGTNSAGQKRICWKIQSTMPYDKPHEAIQIDMGDNCKTYAAAAEAMANKLQILSEHRCSESEFRRVLGPK